IQAKQEDKNRILPTGQKSLINGFLRQQPEAESAVDHRERHAKGIAVRMQAPSRQAEEDTPKQENDIGYRIIKIPLG
ncbi:hypothetical protein, partial [Bifidobacterium longum]|uniref:hypothetical protein n=1 Tax=Bifidobacterium longum TaxID=216816 RepID=UPI003D04003C